MTEKLLCIGLPDLAALEKIARKRKMRIVLVPPEDYCRSIGAMAGYANQETNTEAPDNLFFPQEGILVLCGLSNHRLDRLLTDLQQAKLSIPFKAILTQTNAKWNAYQLAAELMREQKAVAEGTTACET